MAYTATTLITNSYYLSGKYSRGFETVSGEDLNNGLNLLNGLLSMSFADDALVPYYSSYNFNAVVNQEKYEIDNLISVSTLVFYIGAVRYAMSYTHRDQYFGSGRIDNVAALPFNWRPERRVGGTDIYIYFLPNQAYPMTVWGKFGLSEISLNEDLLLTYDRYYIDYLRYALARYICHDSQIIFPDDSNRLLKSLETKVSLVSPPDLTLTKISAFNGGGGLNWGDINIGKGYRPVGG